MCLCASLSHMNFKHTFKLLLDATCETCIMFACKLKTGTLAVLQGGCGLPRDSNLHGKPVLLTAECNCSILNSTGKEAETLNLNFSSLAAQASQLKHSNWALNF